MDKIIRAIILAHYDRCIVRAVHRLRRFPAKDWDGDDSAMHTLWDHWKREMQEEHSIFHDLIEEMVEGVVRQIVEQLWYEDGALMTLGTDALDDLREEPAEPIFDRDAVALELMRKVSGRACDEPHRKELQRRLDDVTRDRFERDKECNQ